PRAHRCATIGHASGIHSLPWVLNGVFGPTALSIQNLQDIEGKRQTGGSGMVASSALVASVSRDHGSESLGARLRHLRTARELTIAQRAEQAGVSWGLISQIERGISNPSIKPLQRLRAAWGVNLWEFLDDPPAVARDAGAPQVSSFVRRKADRPRIIVG